MKKATVIILLFFGSNVFGQGLETPKIKTSSNLKISYNSTIIYPGMRVGFEIPLKRIELNKINKSGTEKKIVKDRFLTTNLSFYHHPTFHTNWYLTAGYTMRKTKSKGFFTEFCPEIGYSRTFLGGETYTVNDQGEVALKRFAGYNYALISVGFGMGYDFSKTKGKPISIFYKFNLLTMFPYNSKLYIRPAMEIGIIYKPKNFLAFNTINKKRTKSKNNEK
jgi:hypothetical protein